MACSTAYIQQYIGQVSLKFNYYICNTLDKQYETPNNWNTSANKLNCIYLSWFIESDRNKHHSSHFSKSVFFPIHSILLQFLSVFTLHKPGTSKLLSIYSMYKSSKFIHTFLKEQQIAGYFYFLTKLCSWTWNPANK